MDEKPIFLRRTKKIISSIRHFFSYEYSLTLDEFQKEKFWMYLFLALSLFFVLTGQKIQSVISIIIAIMIKFRFDYRTGKFRAYIRDKQGIPSSGDFRRMKEEARNVPEQSKQYQGDFSQLNEEV